LKVREPEALVATVPPRKQPRSWDRVRKGIFTFNRALKVAQDHAGFRDRVTFRPVRRERLV